MPSPFPPPNPQPLKVLVAEDNALNQKLLLQMIACLGHQVDVVGNGGHVLEALRRQPYDVVLMDVQMPIMDGLEATRRIRQEWATDRQPYIIALTGHVSPEDLQECLAAGMDDYLTKPIRLETLAGALGKKKPETAISPPDSGNVTPAVLDAETLRDIRLMAGADAAEFLVTAIATYLEEAPPMVQTIREAIAQQQAEVLRSTAHSLKTMSGFLGAKEFSQFCQNLENIGKTGITPDSLVFANQIESEYERVKHALETELQKIG